MSVSTFKSCIRSLCVILSLALFVNSAFATNYYVDASTTSSTQNGSQSAPWKTISQVNSAMGSFRAGDIIYFKKGLKYTGKLNISCSGTSAAHITFTTYGTAAEMPVLYNSSGTVVSIYQQKYVVLDGFKMTDDTMDPNDRTQQAKIGYGISLDGSSYITIKNFDVSLVGVGISIRGDFNTITQSKFGNLRMVRNTPTSVNGDDDYGANPMVLSGNDNIISYNTFRDCWAMSYDYGYDGGAVELFGGYSRNKILYNTAINCNGFMEIGSSNGGTASDNLIAYNLLINNGLLTWANYGGNFSISVVNLQYYNNTIVETNNISGKAYLFDYGGTPTNSNMLSLKNNIFYLATGIDVVKSGKWTSNILTKSNNIYRLSNGSVSNLTLDATEINTTAALFANTSSSDPAAWDYSPVSGSPAIDAGISVGLSKDFEGASLGTKPDIGILEYGSTTPPTTLNLAASATAGTINCNGGTATVTVSATGGTAPYTGTGTFTRGAGTYSYTVTDSKGATASASVLISQPAALAINATAGTILSLGALTTITATVSGGTSPYTYSVNGGIFQSSNLFNSLVAGLYTITVKDAKSCTASKTITITEPEEVLASAKPGTINCYGGTTTVTVSATGGIPPYTGTGTFTEPAGTHSYTVTDAAGTKVTTSIVITHPAVLSLTATADSILSAGSITTIDVTATGGTSPFSYSLNGGSYQTSGSFTGILAGNYTLTVKDSKSCTASKTITITEPEEVVASAIPGTINCYGETTTVTVSATGGIPPYTGTGTFTEAAGTHSYTVTDAAGTKVTTSVAITQPAAMSVNATADSILISGGIASIDATATGGTAPYSYSMNGGSFQTSGSFPGILAGNHIVTVKDSKACTASKTITITEPGALVVSATPGTIKCYGGLTIVTISATGGIAPYKGIGNFTAGPGVHHYTVTDSAGAQAETTVNVGQPAILAIALTTDTSILQHDSTTINATATGGAGPYSYNLNGGPYQLSGVFEVFKSGTFTVTAMDSNSCMVSKTITIIEHVVDSSIVLNAASTAGTIGCNGGTTTVVVSGTGGVEPYTGTGTFTVHAGNYVYTITDAKGDSATTTIVIPEPAAINVTAKSEITATGASTIIINASGGTGGYTYSMDDSLFQLDSTFTNVNDGTHTIIVTDSTSCADSVIITINNTTIRIEDDATSGLCDYNGKITNNSGADNGKIFSLSYGGQKGIDWNVNVPSDGNYLLKWRYVRSYLGAIATLIINGQIVDSSLKFPITDGRIIFDTVTTIVFLNQGNNSIRLEKASRVPFPGIDWFEITGNEPKAGMCDSASLLLEGAARPIIEETAVETLNFKATVYPNPTRGKVTIEFNLPAADKVSIKIMDSYGRITDDLGSKQYGAGRQRISHDFAGKLAGYYIISITGEKGMKSILKLLVQ